MARAKNKQSKRTDKGKPKRSEIQRNRDLPIIANLYLQGHTQASIAAAITQGKKYRLTVQTISKDIKHIEQLWLDRAVVDFNQAKANELAKLDQAEAELWQAWHRSKEPKVIKGKEGSTRQTGAADEGGKAPTLASGKTYERFEQRDPNPRYMDLILDIVDKRLRIIGAFAPEAHVIASVDLNQLDKDRAERWQDTKEALIEAATLAPSIMIDGQVIDAQANGKPKKNSSKNGKGK